jgi:iron complex outermembrane receptor protein
MNLRHRNVLLLSASLATLGYAAPSLAQTAAAPQVDNTPAIAEVVVTARRRAESLQDVPVTITALTSEQLQRSSLRSTEDLRTAVPGVNIGGQRRDDGQFFIRGQGPGVQTTGQRNFSSVATYFAEVPAFVAGPGVFYDMASVQVLKGPQGTLFGRNTTGGAVLFEPNRPTQQNNGYAQVTLGNYNLKQFDGMLNFVPIKDKVAVRIATQISGRDGFTESIYTGQKLDERNYTAFRGSILLTPFDGFENVTIADYRSKHGAGGSAVIRAFAPTASLGGTIGNNASLSALAPLGAFAGLTPAQVLSIPLTVGGGASVGCFSAALPGCPAPLALPAQFAQYGGIAATLAAAYAGGGLALIAPTSQLDQILALQQQLGPRMNQSPVNLYSKQQDWGVINTTTYWLNDNITLKNIFGFRSQKKNESADYDGTPLNFLENLYVNDQNWATGAQQWTEEFQVQGKAPRLKLEYIVGVYREYTTPGFLQEVPGLTLGTGNVRRFDNEDRSDAIFAHLEWNPIAKFGLSGGVRQTWDDRQASLSIFSPTGACTETNPQTNTLQCPIAYRGQFHATTYDITANYKPFDRTLVYLRYAHGYKSGGFNLPAPAGFELFQPENVNSVELGAKTDFRVAAMPVRLDAAFFYDRYKNVQVQQSILFNDPISGAPVTTSLVLNNVDATNRGFEFQGTVLPTSNLSLSAFTSFLESFPTNSVAGAVIEGRQLTGQPRWKYGLSANYVLPMPEDLGSANLSMDWSWQSKVATSPLPGVVPFNPSYGLLNARVEWNDVMHRNVDLAIFATNLLDKDYVLGGYPLGQLGMDSVVYGEPRMFGVSFKYRFGEE